MKKSLLQKPADGEIYADLFLQLLMKINKEDTLQYLLTLVDQLLTEYPESVSFFLKLSARNPTFPFEPLLRLLKRKPELDWYSYSKVSTITATLMAAAPRITDENVTLFSNWIREQLRKSEERDVCNGIAALQKVARKDVFRLAFSASEDGLNLLANLLETKSKNFQILYETLLCLWLLSYNKRVAEQINNTSIIKNCVLLLRKGLSKEKVVRMVLATLANLLNVSTNNEQMLDAGIVKPLESLGHKNWADEDIVNDIKLIDESLQKNITELSSFDMFKKEIISGSLDWSPVHKSEKFWRENVTKFDEDNFKTLGQLKELLSSKEPLVQAVACFDVGEFARFHPRGKNIIQQLGLKLPIMKLMAEAEDPEVKKQALLAVQKLMVTNWEYLTR